MLAGNKRMIGLLAVTFIVLGACDRGELGQDALALQPTSGSDSTELQCEQCHLENDSINPLLINGSGADGKHQPHVGDRGFDCTTCHASYAQDEHHLNGQFDAQDPNLVLIDFDERNPNGYWSGDVAAQSGGCANTQCHGVATVDWYGTDPLQFPDCVECHGGVVTRRRTVLGVNGDFGANSAIASHHIAGSGTPSPGQCKVCHDQSFHMDGGVLLRDADGGNSVGYVPSQPASLEPFCLSCHDSDGATETYVTGGSAQNPFNDGAILGDPPYSFGASIAASWNKAYGHGPTGNPAPGKRLTCAGTGAAGTGCHGNNGEVNTHGSTDQVLAAAPFNYALSTDTYEEQDYGLCFGCHSTYPGVTKQDILGVKQGGLLDGGYGPLGPNGRSSPYYTTGVTTRFRDHNAAGDPHGLNDPVGWDPPEMNLHWFHLGIPGSDFRGTGTMSAIVCVNCHDVHGSNTAAGAMHDALGYAISTDGQGNRWGEITLGANALGDSPTNCGLNCHQLIGPTRAWFEPIVE